MVTGVHVSIIEALKTAVDLHQRGELSEAAIIYDDILETDPNCADALHFKGLLQHQLGDSERAVEMIGRSLELSPQSPAALNNLGNILRVQGQLEESRERYKQVLEIAPDHVDSLINMGSIQNSLGQGSEALEYFGKAMALDPEHASVWHGLGSVYREFGLYEKAEAAYQKATELAPDNSKSLREISKILHRSGRHEEAAATLNRLLERNPDDALAKHMIAAFGASDMPDRASDEYIVETFDSFSASFDSALARLDYQAPQLVGDELKRLFEDTDQKLDILDIGCGTGLCGPIVKPLASKLIGVDLSDGMLRKAQLRNVYDDLHTAELTEYMQNSTVTFDAVICVDTFVYFGKLDEALDAAEAILNPGGYLIFTVERHDPNDCPDDYRLQHHGRYSHTDDYLQLALSAADLPLISLTHVVPRWERSEKVHGTLVVARKA